jgi:ribonuclease BN (tRNA processing enzyme)
VLHAPRGAREAFRRIVGTWGQPDLVENAFDLREYAVDDVLDVGGMTVRFHEVPHFIETHAIEVKASNGGGRFTYGADSRPTEELVEFAQGTDLLMVEATLPRPERTGVRGHLTPAEAGDHGRRANARRLVLTHISDELDATWALEEAQRTYGGDVEVAVEGAVYTV